MRAACIPSLERRWIGRIRFQRLHCVTEIADRPTEARICRARLAELLTIVFENRGFNSYRQRPGLIVTLQLRHHTADHIIFAEGAIR